MLIESRCAKVEKRGISLALAPMEKREENGKRTITGYGSLFYDGTEGTEYSYYDVRERVMPGAFDRAIRDDDVRSFFNHDANFVLGRNTAGTLRLNVDPKGLRYEIDVPDTTAGNDVWKNIDLGNVDGASIMFRATSTWEEDGEDGWIRNITAIEPLYEVGPVVFPAFTNTTASTRSGAMEDILRTELAMVKERKAKELAARKRQFSFIQSRVFR